ncbi:hypothetical protein U27_01433 [Candidatus Vecturithrix granuli]|uniref:Uncharacterized protein n=1 Tax=Vecturithrix granuli TaxID=1499967 RepID=A0A081CAC7_VECG1|nr:hypothetical protein U27_01433 [Candidatus Vecturithrix granuli]
MKTLIKPWKGLKLRSFLIVQRQGNVCENPNKTLEGIKTTEEETLTLLQAGVKTLIKPWKGLKQRLFLELVNFEGSGENPNKTLEGIKTPLEISLKLKEKTCENPNKTLEGIKTFLDIGICPANCPVKTLIKPWKGLKPSQILTCQVNRQSL